MALVLTDLLVRKAKARERAYKLPRERGLWVQVNPNGSKWWRLSYVFQGREKLISLGTYPDVSLELARQRRDDARRLLAVGQDPRAVPEGEKAAGIGGAANAVRA